MFVFLPRPANIYAELVLVQNVSIYFFSYILQFHHHSSSSEADCFIKAAQSVFQVCHHFVLTSLPTDSPR